MVFRLPTHLDSFVPPPSQQTPDQRPWRGALTVSGMRSSDRGSSQTIRVTAVETDGDNRADLWPSQFFTQIIHRPMLKDFQSWVKRHAPPLCTFMPDRHRDANINTVNQTTFRSLSRILFENQTVAIASWGSDDIPGAGVIIFPAQNSSSLLVGALFLTNPFPAFVTSTSSPPIPLSPSQMQMAYGAQYQQPIATYATSSRHHNSTSSQQPMSYPTSPVNDPGSDHRRPQYRYTQRPYSNDRSSLSADSAWPEVKDEEDGNYTTFSPTNESPHYPRSG
ncbi:hypothetical protein D9615_009352 [Tricholomella constricta]|uniref:Uncharacterized protein n=1 Tax=Tricholomella constricta TaxID=117010 RepID=A0A8H5LZH2_9AGAR|nr:hypothetical protein D9615_009352 [Tricholomella constricta]